MFSAVGMRRLITCIFLLFDSICLSKWDKLHWIGLILTFLYWFVVKLCCTNCMRSLIFVSFLYVDRFKLLIFLNVVQACRAAFFWKSVGFHYVAVVLQHWKLLVWHRLSEDTFSRKSRYFVLAFSLCGLFLNWVPLLCIFKLLKLLTTAAV